MVLEIMQIILAKAFRGELVPQDPNDEPASVVLQRIREAREQVAGCRRQATGDRRQGSGKKKATGQRQ